VQKSDDITRRHPDTLIERIVYTLVLLRYPSHVRMRLGIRLYQFACTVGRSAVHQDVLYIRIRLSLHTVQGTL